MLGTREREVNLREERANEYRALRSDNYNEYSFRGYEDYSNNYRPNEEVRYAQKYENIDFYNSQYDCYANENVFRPIELSDLNSEVKPQKKQRSKSKINLSVKTKVMVGVYFALVVLIIAMLLINAIPAVSAQDTSAASASHEIVNEQEANRTADKIQNESGLVKGDGYTYDTQTNWFEKFCDSISNIFG
ncbi:MAG: hypothetical protein K2P12_03210 [Clostridia bacterium]|nr:hypothetical protein [Clostridia bacterium]